MTSSSPGVSLSCQVPSSRKSLTSGGKSSVSRVSFSNCSSDASFADSSGSTERLCQWKCFRFSHTFYFNIPSPSFSLKNCDVEKAAREGFASRLHGCDTVRDWRRRVVGCLMDGVMRREVVRGRARAMLRRDNILSCRMI